MINFDHMNCEIEKKSEHRFNIVIPTRIFEFRAQTPDLCQQWYEEVKRHIEQSEGQNKVEPMVKKAWKFDNISEK